MADKADAAAEDALLLADASDAADGDPCNVTIKVRDSIAFSTTELSVPSTCSEVSVTLEHIGQMPKTAMGHNWVLLPADDLQEIAMAAMTATAESSYIPEGEDRIVAYTKIIGGGESDTVTFSLSDLEEGTEYAYVCTFPGHWSVMRGKFTVTG
ncbi:MAG: azurin [Pseudomonadota bacterium]